LSKNPALSKIIGRHADESGLCPWACLLNPIIIANRKSRTYKNIMDNIYTGLQRKPVYNLTDIIFSLKNKAHWGCYG